ncbi:MAG: hypothetical protein EA393_03995 [Bacteroidetes bacterium]|nr:MAG: hypothetical protein EA393_03995 [Bacteroidota bacterium]
MKYLNEHDTHLNENIYLKLLKNALIFIKCLINLHFQSKKRSLKNHKNKFLKKHSRYYIYGKFTITYNFSMNKRQKT